LVGKQRASDPLAVLTAREQDVLQLMAEGRSNRAIGTALYMGTKTVETHVRSILMKLAISESPTDNRRVLAVLAYLRGS
jgi:serine/threonine-protein kinase